MSREIVKTALIFMLTGLVLGGIISYGMFGRKQSINEYDTNMYVDTIQYYHSVPKDSTVVRYITKILPVKNYKEDITANSIDTLFEKNHIQISDKNTMPRNILNECDSIAVKIPITQKRYDSNDYQIWVSGYEVHLDSLHIFHKTKVITEKEPKKRFGIGVQAGIGFGFLSHRIEPYIGVGINYRIY